MKRHMKLIRTKLKRTERETREMRSLTERLCSSVETSGWNGNEQWEESARMCCCACGSRGKESDNQSELCGERKANKCVVVSNGIECDCKLESPYAIRIVCGVMEEKGHPRIVLQSLLRCSR